MACMRRHYIARSVGSRVYSSSYASRVTAVKRRFRGLMKGHDTPCPRMFLVPSSAISVHISRRQHQTSTFTCEGFLTRTALETGICGVAEAMRMMLHFG
jgi:hypothetical protein